MIQSSKETPKNFYLKLLDPEELKLDFYEELFRHYPDYIEKDFKEKKIVLINAIDYDKLSFTE